ncbi:hypothetical protein M406DRAFT_335212 [Cryphonectria parasitica EP155]|uniref:Clr5 domain-containing protein n=1 Tax=Cryphonectria parasitica (strain ATCC 38755 / EP155) TaxID=660469 RepID=A0A9P4XSM5_CRYP1|nr:uncharacterized protein M406DRAFT_335212 [Cryphonectria parasitica EP155]KAF3760000.1 hypothetical protein M406DRAFT_335212 [Cryphonectria parasitica EP155]
MQPGVYELERHPGPSYTLPVESGSECDNTLSIPSSTSATTNAASPYVAPNKPGYHDEDAEWEVYKDEIIRLYWHEGLPTHEVRDTMDRLYGFCKSVKMYKYRFKKWNVRKNFTKQEALDLAARQDHSSGFWPETRGQRYRQRIVRHLRQKDADEGIVRPRGGRRTGKNRTQQQQQQRQRPQRQDQQQDLASVIVLPGRINPPDVFQAFERAFYHADIYLENVSGRRHSRWFTRPPALEFGEGFFDLFVQGMEDLTRGIHTQEVFSALNSAFDSLKGLISTDHPLIYYRIASRVASCKVYPSSDVCIKLCRLLADYCLNMTRVLHGDSHPLTFWWMLQIMVLDSGDPSALEDFLEISRMQSGKHLVQGKGLVHVAMYVPSEARDRDQDSLRATIQTLSSDPSRISEVQEARLALAEQLLQQEEKDESLRILEEAIASKHLDPHSPSSRTFWISELLWRAEALERSISMLRETVDLVKVEEEIGTTSGRDATLDYVSVLAVLRAKLEWLRWEEDLRLVNAALAPLMERRGSPLKVRFVSSDLEMDPDIRYQTGSSSASPESTTTLSPSSSLPIRPLS